MNERLPVDFTPQKCSEMSAIMQRRINFVMNDGRKYVVHLVLGYVQFCTAHTITNYCIAMSKLFLTYHNYCRLL